MRRKLEYDFLVQQLNRARGASFRLVVFAVGFLGLGSAAISAQINGMPASVTSPGFGGRQVNGVAPSVTSLGPRGFTPAAPTCCFRGGFPANPNPTPKHHHHSRVLPWAGAYAVPYSYAPPYYGYNDSGDDTADDPAGDQYGGGPTIFDRRGPGTAPPPSSAPHPGRARSDGPQPETSIDAAAQPETTAPDQPQTVLVFKDGHQLEVANYAIVGSTLYDLTGGHRQKISLADLDLTATAKQNDDRGVDFQIPAAAEAN
jgi:hypothetical protein